MAGSQDAPLEEILWRSPSHVQMMGGYLHSNNSMKLEFLCDSVLPCSIF